MLCEWPAERKQQYETQQHINTSKAKLRFMCKHEPAKHKARSQPTHLRRHWQNTCHRECEANKIRGGAAAQAKPIGTYTETAHGIRAQSSTGLFTLERKEPMGTVNTHTGCKCVWRSRAKGGSEKWQGCFLVAPRARRQANSLLRGRPPRSLLSPGGGSNRNDI